MLANSLEKTLNTSYSTLKFFAHSAHNNKKEGMAIKT